MLPLTYQIMGAIEKAQENGHRMTQKIFEKCGKASTTQSTMSKRSISKSDDIVFSENLNSDSIPVEALPVKLVKPVREMVKARKTGFERIVLEIRKVSEGSMGFWKELPHVMCDTQDVNVSLINDFNHLYFLANNFILFSRLTCLVKK